MNWIANARRISFFLIFAVAITTSSGCSVLKGVFVSKSARKKQERERLKAQIDQYVAARNQAKLEQFCEDKQVDYTNRKIACKSLSSIRIEEFEKSSCDRISERFTALNKFVQRRSKFDQVKELFYKGGVKIAQCKQWDFVFTSLLHWGNRERMGSILLSKIDQSGQSSEAAFISWLKKQEKPFAFKKGGYAAYNAVHYLKHKKSFSHCRLFVKLARRADSPVKGHFIQYFHEASCKNAIALIIAQLSSEKSGDRRQACFVLGKLGSSRVIPKLRILSYSDPSFQIRKRKYVAYRFYPVRSACRAAMGKIQLRAQ